MCTVSFVPLSKEQFIFTSSRDVGYKRKKALPPKLHDDLIYPTDTAAGGTWFVTSKKYTLCLLNGAFLKHDMSKTFVKSRGIVVLDAIKYENINNFIENYALEGVEPFTLVIIENGKSISELRWDESKKHLKHFDYSKPQIWSSSTLYSPEIVNQREQWFIEWLKENEANDILNFHKNAGFTDKENDVLMDRGFIGTVSITNLERKQNQGYTHYLDLRDKEQNDLAFHF